MKMKEVFLILLVVVISAINLTSALLEPSPIVKTKTGQLRGRLIQVPVGRQDIYEFTGIPFAEPPVARRRFKKPVPKTPWKDVLDATKPAKSCYEVATTGPGSLYEMYLREMILAGTEESEDCLYLNMWVPRATLDAVVENKRPPSKLLSVYVFIHGGSFISGSSMLNLYNGTIMSGFANIIFVSIQYRLGSFGFAYFGKNEDCPGNVGLWDQLEALKWIHENIAAFGGNNSEVTLGGQSAGASSVTFHLLSPYSKRYFQRAIVQSGTATSPWAYRSKELAASVTDIVVFNSTIKCNNISTHSRISEKLKCLRSISASDLAKADAVPLAMGFGLVPVIDGDFVPKNPNDMLLAGDFYRVPLLIGANKDEGSMDIVSSPEAMTLLPYENNPFASLDNLNYAHYEQLFKLLETAFYAASGNPQPNAADEIVFNAVQLHYWPTRHQGLPQGAEVLDAAVQAVGDYSLTCPSFNWANIAASFLQNASIPVFAYYFTQPPATSFLPEWMGVYHGLEMIYAFGEPFAPYAKYYYYNADHKIFSKIMMEYWGNFIKHGDPNLRDEFASCEIKTAVPAGPGGGCPLRNWPTFIGKTCLFQINELNILKQVFNYGSTVNCALKARDCLFWSELFPKLMDMLARKKQQK